MRERLALLREYLKNRLAFGKNKKRFYTHYGGTC